MVELKLNIVCNNKHISVILDVTEEASLCSSDKDLMLKVLERNTHNISLGTYLILTDIGTRERLPVCIPNDKITLISVDDIRRTETDITPTKPSIDIK